MQQNAECWNYLRETTFITKCRFRYYITVYIRELQKSACVYELVKRAHSAMTVAKDKNTPSTYLYYTPSTITSYNLQLSIRIRTEKTFMIQNFWNRKITYKIYFKFNKQKKNMIINYHLNYILISIIKKLKIPNILRIHTYTKFFAFTIKKKLNKVYFVHSHLCYSIMAFNNISISDIRIISLNFFLCAIFIFIHYCLGPRFFTTDPANKYP